MISYKTSQPEGYLCLSDVDYAKITFAVNVIDHWTIILQFLPRKYGYGHLATPRPLVLGPALTMTLLVVLSPLGTSQKCAIMILID